MKPPLLIALAVMFLAPVCYADLTIKVPVESSSPVKIDNWVVLRNQKERISIGCEEYYKSDNVSNEDFLSGTCKKFGKVRREKIKK